MNNNKYIQTFESYKKSNDLKNITESVKQIDDIYKVGGVEIQQSLINSYVKKVKDETGKNLRQLYSDMEIAEELVKFAVGNNLNSDDIPSSALLGGGSDDSEDLTDDLDTDVDSEDLTDTDTDDDLDTDDDDDDLDTDDDDDLDTDDDDDLDTDDDDFEEASESEDESDESDEEESIDIDEEENDLPI